MTAVSRDLTAERQINSDWREAPRRNRGNQLENLQDTFERLQAGCVSRLHVGGSGRCGPVSNPTPLTGIVFGADRSLTDGDDEVAKAKKIVRYSKDDVKDLKAYSKAKTPAVKVSKLMKRSVAALRTKAHALGIDFGH